MEIAKFYRLAVDIGELCANLVNDLSFCWMIVRYLRY